MTQSSQIIEELDDCFVKTAGNIVKYYADEEERQRVLEKLRDLLKENCMESARIKAANKIRKDLENLSAFEPERKVEDVTKEYRTAISEIQVNSLEDNRLLTYDRQIQGLLEANEAVSGNGPDDTDADLQLMYSQINVIDPISKTRMTDPVRNAVCGHVYDKESLVAMLRKNKNTRCPVVGCTSMDYIDLNQCRPDVVTKMYLEKNPA
ncbi:E3 SUMO-protein ligase NSE2-like [Pogonomyrmex barbatus]|uniref:E3 SUMO-protein ligase NSE2 n=1 Tax=Pogonomyrmex barbatus TaxID=144034 RepID=A0A6I9WS19_9HYME|nr:E3 SUMO-protein ligase NSE2-like [Pogonomyrmex barbatus]XP_011646713.1 E3 SUMO-protein ligase NSE2-like [Pogonomyrmex barbatus]XP_011646714.1 E3 SUMO-protein ligase NSE2-like [Pogonomyrmex barbatus]XP_011646715.1 E3 SUMO-protein ligase NSE2-like [Pogonomyrmex barbatus]XP_025075593.1 E3 SUMO-protein ligase NSE2-like [Pogonomyrmex barbatus]